MEGYEIGRSVNVVPASVTTRLQQSIARVRGGRDNRILGTAFLISAQHVMTCAHVVNEALERRWDESTRPNESLLFEFPFANEPLALAGTVVEWPPPGNRVAADIGWKRLRDWLNEDRSFRVWLQRVEEFAIEWKSDRDPSYLLSGRRLDEAKSWLSRAPT
jgi:hypothetical protein